MRVDLREVLRAALALGVLMVLACGPAPGAESTASDTGRGEVEDSETGPPPPAGLDGAVGADGEQGSAPRAPRDAGSEAATARPSDAAAAARESGVASATLPPALRAAGIQTLFPAPGDTEVCPDPALRITFAAPPSLGSRGRVQLFDGARAETPLATLDLAQPMGTQQVAGASLNVPRAAFVEGNAIVLLLPRPLEYGHEYFVRAEAGALIAPGDAPLALDDTASWRFRTRGAPPQDMSLVRVALDGSGAFCSLQGAFDALAKVQGARVEIAAGTYRGIAHARGLSGLTIRGAGRKSTILAGTNNEQLNGGTSKRALVSIENGRDVVLEALTIHNETPQGGSQAEALRLEGCERCQVRDAEILSLQDTILWSGRIYARDLLIAGNVDFVWGTGAVYFERCELKTLGRKGYMVQARNGASGFGYVFVDSKLTSDPGISGHFLARIDASVYPSSHVALIDCELGAHIDPAGFLVSAGATSGLRFWEYQSKDARGQPLDVGRRASFVKQLSSQEAAQMRDVKAVLGGWAPE